MKRISAIASSLLLAGCSVFGIRSGYEQPSYEVVEVLPGAVEIRRYGVRLAAETTVSAASSSEARNEAFSILADYIFGENRPAEKIGMTAPVEVEESATEIAMTAPVETAASE